MTDFAKASVFKEENCSTANIAIEGIISHMLSSGARMPVRTKMKSTRPVLEAYARVLSDRISCAEVLKSSNQALVPTPVSVTLRAGHEARQPLASAHL